MAPVPTVRVLADDLTGALDSAARFVPLTGTVPVVLGSAPLPPSAAIDSATRGLDLTSAAAIVSRMAEHLAGADIAFKKIDSLLRGNIGAEVAACMPYFDRCVLAPAFPFQGRITRSGRQLLNGRDIGVDLDAQLRRRGLDIPVLDAATDVDLDAIVARHRATPGRILWCGTAGLAGALAGRRPVPRPALPRPILALIGSDHAVSADQLAATRSCLHDIRTGDMAERIAVERLLRSGAAAVRVALPDGISRPEAARRIAACFSAVLDVLPGTGTVFIAGGETLRGVCDSLAAERLDVDGELMPGVPTAILRGGRRDGQRVVSKSGAFGDAGLLARVFAG